MTKSLVQIELAEIVCQAETLLTSPMTYRSGENQIWSIKT